MKSKIVRCGCVFILAAFFFSAPSFAQANADSSEALHKARTKEKFLSIDTLKVKLALTAEQETRIREIFATNREEARQERELYKGVASAQARLVKERFDKFDKDILAVLDANQKKKYEALKRELGNRNKETPRKKTSPKTNTENTP